MARLEKRTTISGTSAYRIYAETKELFQAILEMDCSKIIEGDNIVTLVGAKAPKAVNRLFEAGLITTSNILW